MRVPASKSIANRELVLSAEATGRSRLELGPLDPGDDVHTMYDALAALGHKVRWTGDRIEAGLEAWTRSRRGLGWQVEVDAEPSRFVDFGNQVLSAMRHAFGSHLEKPAGEKA